MIEYSYPKAGISSIKYMKQLSFQQSPHLVSEILPIKFYSPSSHEIFPISQTSTPMPRFPKEPIEELVGLARVRIARLTSPLPDNLTSQTVLKTKDVRLDLHKDLRKPDEVVARVQANTEAQSSSVKKWIREAKQKGHSGTHKKVSEVRYNMKTFDIDEFEKQIKANSV